MPETKSFTFNHAEVAATLVKQLDLHEGIWGVSLEFGLAAANVPSPHDQSIFMPAAVLVVNKFHLQRFEVASNLTVDAAAINPPVGRAKSRRVKI